MDFYNFTYKDVLKRYERIINKPSKFEIRLLATILLIITIVNITSLCFASEDVSSDTKEDVYFETLENCVLSANASIQANEDYNLYYIQLEKGYTYYISLDYVAFSRIGYSDSISVGSHVYDYTYFENGGHIDIIVDANATNYLFFDYSSNSYYPTYTIYREPTGGINGAVNGLVKNVGISQIWDIFDTSIGFVGVVVLAAFGIFLVVIAIRKMQKGKSEF